MGSKNREDHFYKVLISIPWSEQKLFAGLKAWEGLFGRRETPELARFRCIGEKHFELAPEIHWYCITASNFLLLGFLSHHFSKEIRKTHMVLLFYFLSKRKFGDGNHGERALGANFTAMTYGRHTDDTPVSRWLHAYVTAVTHCR